MIFFFSLSVNLIVSVLSLLLFSVIVVTSVYYLFSFLQRRILVPSLRGETYAVIVICFDIFNHGICLDEKWVRASARLLGVRTSGRSALPRTSPGLIQKNI